MKRLTFRAPIRFSLIYSTVAWLALIGLVCPSNAQIILTSGNSTAEVRPNSQAGMDNWTVDGVNQLAQQWFWYRIGAVGPEAPINSINPLPVVNTPAANQLTLTYANALLSVRVDYTLTGAAPGSGTAHLQESLTIINVSGTALDLHFFQYSDFNLGGVPGGDTVQFLKNPFGNYKEADQSNGNSVFSETVTTGGGVIPGANRAEGNFFPNTLNSLNDALPTTLNNTPVGVPVGPGDVTWAFEWDDLLDPNGPGLTISKIKTIEIVPEPGTLALAGLGLTMLLSLRRRK